MKRRFVIAALSHETNTFSPVATPRASFGPGAPLSGQRAIDETLGTNRTLAGLLEVARAAGAEFTVPVAAAASPSAPPTRATFDAMVDEILADIRKGCDALLIELHGAMVVEGYDDGEGELLARVRRLAPDLPIAVGLDFHAQMTQQMIDNATVITGYRTYPHIDTALTGRRAATTLLRALDGEIDPVMVWGKIPILSSTLAHAPSREPMKAIMDRAIDAEARGLILNASIFGGFPQADIPHLGLSAVVVCDRRQPGAVERGTALRDEWLDDAWRARKHFLFDGEPLEDSIARAKSLTEGPVVLVDHGDNCASGGTQDVMRVLEEVIRQDLDDVVAGNFCDPQAVARMIEAGVGAEITLDIGGRTDMPSMGLKGQPLRLSGKVRALTDGEFTVTGPMGTGSRIRMGRTAVLDTGKVQVVVTEDRAEPFDLGIFTHCGIDPRAKRYVLIKSRQHFRAGFEPIARQILMCMGPGVTASDPGLFRYTKRPVPFYPFETEGFDRA